MPRLKQILFPVDFSQPCGRTADAVAAATKHFRGGLTLLHAASVPLFPEMTYPGRHRRMRWTVSWRGTSLRKS